ncbi:MAG: biotin--[acetyl-CoA-carboxylase] ligase [Actinomycetales bacterium]|nr:biotin--[acetyl-CoA-carboxylase] ligase [Actinomycetales bacterium]
MGIEGLKVDAINSKVAQYWSVSVMEETSSTQFELANNFVPGKVLVAEYQSAGRGRLDRKFEVPPRKGLTFSFAINAEKDFGWIPLITGLAVSKAINNYVGENIVEIKWPNDLLVNGKKLAGILSEKIKTGAVVGVGINIFQEQNELPIENALSLSMVAKVDRSELLIVILNELGNALSNIENFKNEYREKCVTIGKTVQVTLPNGDIIEDVAVGISETGALLLNSREISVGDIVHLR